MANTIDLDKYTSTLERARAVGPAENVDMWANTHHCVTAAIAVANEVSRFRGQLTIIAEDFARAEEARRR